MSRRRDPKSPLADYIRRLGGVTRRSNATTSLTPSTGGEGGGRYALSATERAVLSTAPTRGRSFLPRTRNLGNDDAHRGGEVKPKTPPHKSPQQRQQQEQQGSCKSTKPANTPSSSKSSSSVHTAKGQPRVRGSSSPTWEDFKPPAVRKKAPDSGAGPKGQPSRKHPREKGGEKE
ncbi:hypothetical protein DQ04_00821000 [Trypanosoma grayi]|uniref:hypothetical protein n=1 Tax=Trypanosoma grayi TaxID=71804 RepID=UPI0004F47ACC|nr:hypothetical protein DQ04_00821000 [Trypanosoma grayi]KEG13722.1 hypothetical protein DQ04_00821000 [Trypanosoma grayi]